MSIRIKIPVKKLEGKSVCDKVEELLAKDPEYGYQVSGIMVKTFGIKEKEFDRKSFKDWPKGLPTMYSRIRKCLEKMVSEGRANKRREGKGDFYWIVRK